MLQGMANTVEELQESGCLWVQLEVCK